MAIYFQNTLVQVSDYLKISTRYSSSQSLWRAKKKGLITLKNFGGVQFGPATAEQVSGFYKVPSWQGLNLVTPQQLPATIVPISRVSKTIGAGEAAMLEWALLNQIDVYWIGGSFFTSPAEAKNIAVQKGFGK